MPLLEAPTVVSVIVPTKNRCELLATALESIRALEGPDLTFELIVVDNGSTDASESVARGFGAIVLKTLSPGAASARNVGIKAATGAFLAFLDDDDVWLPGHIRPQVAMLRARPELSGVVGQIVLTDSSLNDWQPAYPLALSDSGDVFAAFLDQCPQLGATVVRTSVRDTLAPFDPEFEGGEDWDWHLRLALGHKVGFVQIPCMLFRGRPIGVASEQEWRRLRTARRIFTCNVLRAARRGRNPRTAVRSFLRHNGRFCSYFLLDARRRTASSQPGAYRALGRAALCSPPHTMLALAREVPWAGVAQLCAAAIVVALMCAAAVLGLPFID